MKFYTNIQVIGNTVHVREIKNGERRYKKIRYSPSLFVRSNVKETLDYKTLSNQNLMKVDFDDIRSAKEWVRENSEASNFEYFGMSRFQYAFMSDRYKNTIKYDMKQINIKMIDIETESEKSNQIDPINPVERINLITVEDFHTGKSKTFGLHPFKRSIENVTYIWCRTEEDLLEEFIEYWKSDYPDIVTGWWISGFDIPYIVNRIKVLFGEDKVKELSPFKKVKDSTFKLKGREMLTHDILGISILDYQRMYAKFTADPRENFKLDYIIDVELNDERGEHEKLGKIKHQYKSFREFYTKDWDTFVEYNVQDVKLIKLLDEKCKMLALTLYISYDGKSNFDDIFSQVRVWDCKIYNKLNEKGIQVPQLKRTDKNEKYKGAFVKQPIPGLYKWLVEFDFASLYPNLLRTLNIGPETKLKKLPKVTEARFLSRDIDDEYNEAVRMDAALAVNGVLYDRRKASFFSDLIRDMFNMRKACRKTLKETEQKLASDKTLTKDQRHELENLASELDLKQYAIKIQMNSLYGAIGNEYFRFYDVDNAEAITLGGRFVIQYVGNLLNDYINVICKTTNVPYVVYQDTDSIYLSVDKLLELSGKKETLSRDELLKFVNSLCVKKIEPKIAEFVNTAINKYFNGIPEYLSMARGTISEKGIWTAKKRYALSVLDKEGLTYDKPKLKVTGLEIKKSVIPKFCKERMTECLKLILATDSNDPVIEKIKEVKKEFFSKPIEQISIPRKVNGIEKYDVVNVGFKKGTPSHVKAAINYNRYLEKLKLVNNYVKINSGDYIRLLHLKVPNLTQHSMIAFLDELPKEMKLDSYIDYELQYKKSFLEPLEIILKAIKYTSEKKGNLKEWF